MSFQKCSLYGFTKLYSYNAAIAMNSLIGNYQILLLGKPVSLIME